MTENQKLRQALAIAHTMAETEKGYPTNYSHQVKTYTDACLEEIGPEFDYLAESARTASGSFHGELVSFVKFINTLDKFIVAANELDRYKKLLFYGEDANKGRLRDVFGTADGSEIIATLSGPMASEEKMQQVVHAILGSATETGEMVEALFKTLYDETGLGIDLVNVAEEVFDDQWYHAMFCRAAGITFEEGQQKNIAKLRKRFPEKFTEEHANNRNLEAEREVLES